MPASVSLALVALMSSACGGGFWGSDDAAPSPAPTPTPSSPSPSPSPSPAPSPTAAGPTVDASKIPMGFTGYSTDYLTDTTTTAEPNDIGAFRTVCLFSHMAFDDPIVFPGQAGKSHLHVFFGNSGTNANSTAASIASTGNATCRGGTVNRTAYWAPAMIETGTGAPVAPSSLITYYKTGYEGVTPGSVQALPQSLRMIAGDSKASSGADNPGGRPTRFTCMNNATGNGSPWTSSIQACKVGDSLWQVIVFPQCWDGVNLDSPDHKSHMSYPVNSNGCPSTHPVPLPEITMNVIYTITAADAPQRWRLASDAYDANQPGGYSSHADWFNGWKPDVMATWIRNCDQASMDCKAGLLGNGKLLLGVGN